MHSGALCKAAPAVAKLFMQMGPAAARAAILITWGGGMANKILSPLKKKRLPQSAVQAWGKKKKKTPTRKAAWHTAAARPVPAQPRGAAGEERGEAGWCSANPFPMLPPRELGYSTAAAAGLAVPQFPCRSRWSPERGRALHAWHVACSRRGAAACRRADGCSDVAQLLASGYF